MTIYLLQHLKKISSENLFINPKDNSILIKIPAGKFVMGDNLDDDCPEHTLDLDDYYIGAFTVTNQQYKNFVDETGHRLPDDADLGYPLWRNGTYLEQYADHPVTCVSWDDAVAYCQWAGLTLPTEAQWEKAARGPNNNLYPWGNSWESKHCLNYMIKGAEQTCNVYDYPEGISFYGLHNMSGNVIEWCHDYYQEDYYPNSPRQNPLGPETSFYRVARGGSWGSNTQDCRSANRSDYNLPEERSSAMGFRVAMKYSS